MDTRQLTNIEARLDSLGLALPTEVATYRDIAAAANRSKHTLPQRVALEGITTADQVADEIKARVEANTFNRELAATSTEIKDRAEEHATTVLVDSAEDVIEELRPIAEKAWAVIDKAATKIGTLDAESAIAADGVKDLHAARQAAERLFTAWDIRDTIAKQGGRAEGIDRQVEPGLRAWDFDTLQSHDAYEAAPNTGDRLSNWVATSRIPGVTFRWSTFEQQQESDKRLGREQRNTEATITVFDPDARAYRKVPAWHPLAANQFDTGATARL